ncbi:hypothetical protein LSH36_912g01034 [Paralvinella palmiformis]|uniref:Uncharacterized protein n=1 Tax=Paralvinella palmiformis TaxID=53620 RepID=A0AAD9IYD4_9ANNE|nr:hypothetical protein LSH36_912g01034 [Paralvinella palmiformis]
MWGEIDEGRYRREYLVPVIHCAEQDREVHRKNGKFTYGLRMPDPGTRYPGVIFNNTVQLSGVVNQHRIMKTANQSAFPGKNNTGKLFRTVIRFPQLKMIVMPRIIQLIIEWTYKRNTSQYPWLEQLDKVAR